MLAKAVYQSQIYRLTFRIREQARSHILIGFAGLAAQSPVAISREGSVIHSLHDPAYNLPNG